MEPGLVLDAVMVSVSDRWQDYSAVGKRLKGTRFIAFKVPLKQVSLSLQDQNRSALTTKSLCLLLLRL